MTQWLFLVGLPLFGVLGASAQSRENWPKPEIMVAPVYPRLALARRIEVSIVVDTEIDLHGRVTRALALNGPCLYSSPSPRPDEPGCDFARDAGVHRGLAEQRFKESLDESLPEPQRRARYKESEGEDWLAAQDQVYAAAEQAARQWAFQSLLPARPGGRHGVHLTFRFLVGDAATIQVVDPWSVTVVGTRFPPINE
jgi:hypothetical protein